MVREKVLERRRQVYCHFEEVSMIEIEVSCAVCGDGLEIVRQWGDGSGDIYVTVEPCEYCLRQVYESRQNRGVSMGKDFTVTICEPERRAMFEAVFGTATVHVESPFPTKANLPGRPDSLIYELDLESITPEQREKLVAFLAEKFGISAEEVDALLEAHGVPILADDCVVGVTNPLWSH